MSNQYTFHCPVKKEGAAIAHCETVHSNGMQGKPHETEDKICALAHACFMCPFRNAVRVGGPWSHPDKMPRAKEPQEKPAKLPRDLVVYALAHTEPNGMDYRRVGLRGENVGMYTEFFRDLQASVTGDGPIKQAMRHTQSSAPETSRKPKSAADAMTDGFDKNDMADAVTELAKKERQKAPEKRSSPRKQSAPAKKPKRTESAAQSAPAASKKPISLAERAKMMKQRKQA